ncbi:MAG: sulfatase-like hydrolase/transferase, partial [bacterium]|nr:sulfatase-like hydrolase/transferase [bacterium]
ALLTGSYPIRVAEPGNRKNQHTVLHPRELTIAEMLKQQGYATAMIGKWHVAGNGEGKKGRGTGPYRAELMPNAQGFDYFFGTPAHNGTTRELDEWKTELHRNERVLEVDTSMDTITERETEEALAFVRKHHDRPFFLYLSYNMVHVVLGASAKFRGSSRRGLYGDSVREIDHGVGRLLETLDRLGLDEKTLVVFTSDNGPWVEGHLREHGGRAFPMRGYKMTTWEGGARVPGIMRWPGKIAGGQVSREIASTLDLFPTFAALAGAEVPGDRKLDGVDLSGFLLGHSESSGRDAFFHYAWTFLQAVRQGDWKLVVPRPANPGWTSWYGRMIDAVEAPELYNLAADVSEMNNVAARHPGKVAELTRLYQRTRNELGDYNLVGSAVRFFDADPPVPGSAREYREEQRRQADIYTRLSTGRATVGFRYQDAIAHEPGVVRRDPSDVIRVGGTYYVWYTKVTRQDK